MRVELGLIEGFYGRLWSWAERKDAISFHAARGFHFYLYAPKGDAFLRRRWQEPHSDADTRQLAALAAHCRDQGMRFGIGLSPYNAVRDFDDTARAALARKLEHLAQIGASDVAILFDDMRGDVPQLAQRQAELVAFIAARAGAQRLMVCPSYYSDDPMLDRLFGPRPAHYLRDLGRLLDPAIGVFWTGEEICAREQSPRHLERVAEELGRKPLLWDNYPVNDTARMSQHLHLRAFTGRPAALAGVISGHGVNGALQPTLTRIPALTLVDGYAHAGTYTYLEATHRAAVAVLGEPLAGRVCEDLALLQDVGRDRLGRRAAELRARYLDATHPGAREIVAWLDGEYQVTDALVRSQ